MKKETRMSLTGTIFNDTDKYRPSMMIDMSLYEAAKKKTTKEFMRIIGIIKKELNYKKWIGPDAHIINDLKATKKQFDNIITKVSNSFKLKDKDKSGLSANKTPAALEKYVMKCIKK